MGNAYALRDALNKKETLRPIPAFSNRRRDVRPDAVDKWIGSR